MRVSGTSPVVEFQLAVLVSALAATLVACGSAAVPARHRTTPAIATTFDPRAYYGKRALAVQRGEASFYADSFAGRRTANGERYQPDAYTAAHRTLPFGSVLRVTREKTGDWVLVRVNDRGPYGPRTRVLDLSKQAARRLSMLRDGVVAVRLEILELGPR
jgi:rare lipoprotein A